VGIFLTLGAGRGVAGDGGRGGVLGRGREGTEGKRGVGRLSALFIGAMAVRRGGGQGRGTTRRIEGGGLVPTSGWRPGCVPVDRGPAVAQHCSNWGSAGATDAWAPAGSGTERERRGTGRVGQPGRKKRSGPSPDEQESF
jgi:hypothetical protein